ncbi:MAG: serine hydroxymethyltransferase [Chloroflexi bacterium]|nr:serine hydroxymethyltransferase [Chloroflexota bacterium]
MSILSTQDPEVARAIADDERRLVDELVLIASENYASAAVREATGSVMTNKYAEGYPGRRYYAGTEFVDQVEILAQERAKELFGCDHANVQPHSGSQANMAAYFARLAPEDVVLGMRLDQGGHLTHGSPVNFSGRFYDFVSYGVDRETEYIDYDEVEELAKKHRPKIIVCGATAYSREIDFERFGAIAAETGALLMADIAHIAGLIAGGVHQSPIPVADIVTTTTHKTLRGPRGAMIMCKEEYRKSINSAVFPRVQGGPLMHQIAAKAVAFKEALQPEFKEYARRIVDNAKALASGLSDGGLRIITGGTDNHLMLVDLTPLGINGKEAQDGLRAAGIITNRNAIPFDKLPPMVTSGLRLGTPALSSRDMGEQEMARVAEFILEALHRLEDPAELQSIRGRVADFARNYPAPGVTDARETSQSHPVISG